MRFGRDLVVCAVLVAAAVWATLVWIHAPNILASFDLYSYYLPNMVYAAARLRDGGHGLLWNPFQNCGQPFLGISSTGALYPASAFFLMLPPLKALYAVTIVNFIVAGVGMYALARELGVGRAAALCGAVAFELGNSTVELSSWGPQMGGPYVWLPWALLFCERLLRAPSLRNVTGLAVSLALPLLPGFPQAVFFTYQVVALRVFFEFATVRVTRPWRTLAAVGLGLALAPLLDAVQLAPALELLLQGVRGSSLSEAEIHPEVLMSWEGFREVLAFRGSISNPIVVIPCVVAAASWLQRSTRRRAIFYALLGLLYFLLALEADTPLFALYQKLPLGALFRAPERFLWIPSFCLAVLTAYGANAIIAGASADIRWRRWGGVICCTMMLLALNIVVLDRLYVLEWILGGMVIAGAVLATRGERWRTATTVLVVAPPLLDLVLFTNFVLPTQFLSFSTRQPPPRRLVHDEHLLAARTDLFDELRSRLTAQDRVFLVPKHAGFEMMPKSASLFEIRSIQDYEPQPSRRSAAYLVMLQTGAQLTSLNQYYYTGPANFAYAGRRRLLDLAAARFVLIDARVAELADRFAAVVPDFERREIADGSSVIMYENPQALPRARFVPTVAVVPDAANLLRRLAFGKDDLSAVALLEQPPPSGFRGEPGQPGAGSAKIVVDEPERVVVRVTAPGRGFLHLADQFYPGWRATVNGAPAPILRANYLFRLVEVPAGESTVEFRYASRTVRVGVAITAATVFGLVVAAFALRRRRLRGETAPAATAPSSRSEFRAC